MTTFTTATRKAGLVSAIAFTIVLFAGAAQADDRVTAPNPNDVAVLRGLLALQHPALRQAMPAVMPVTPSPASLTTEPGTPSSTPGTTQGQACVSPDCGTQAETSNTRLHSTFRASLERSVAAAGFDSRRL